MSDIIDDTNDITEFHTNLKRGHLAPKFMTAKQLVNLLQNATPHLPDGLTFPIIIKTKNIIALEKVSTITAYVEGSKIIAIISIPLITNQAFKIMEVKSIPTHIKGNTYATLVTRSSLIIVNTNINKCIIANTEDLRDCKNIASQYLCNPFPVYKITDNMDCEYKLWLEPSIEMPKNCRIEYFATNHSIWIKTSRPEKWIYATHEPKKIELECNQRTTRTIIERSGTITILSKCKLHTQEITLQSQKTTYSAHLNLNTATIYNLTLPNQTNSYKTNKEPYTQIQLHNILQKNRRHHPPTKQIRKRIGRIKHFR
ncbi:uncharacterized protein LOC143186456 [Calliopsis andreniformis]|uniref:uncharacterized protein LOC143186456 n=1 Tax=Calliopsis andreniformis TaxID=337506 RepID=UPI003FCDA722